jgi:DNA-binding beta-propeller fold protein YncE
MKIKTALHFLICVIALCSYVSAAPPGELYHVARTIPVGGAGTWDYATLSDDGKLLYMARETHTMVVDVAAGKVVADIKGNKLTHGVALVPALNRGFITDGDQASVTIFDLKTNEVLGSVAAAPDADGIIYDPGSNKVLVACGDAGALVVISPDLDPKTGKIDGKVDLGGKPEFIAADGKGTAFVNLTDKASVAVVDIKALKVTSTWSMAPGARATGLAIDKDNGRLFIGCRNQHMIVMSTADGKVLADTAIGTGVDAAAYSNGVAMTSCGDGTLWIMKETSPSKFEVVQTLKTAVTARTMAMDKTTGTVYLPCSDVKPGAAGARPVPIPDTFKVLVVEKN